MVTAHRRTPCVPEKITAKWWHTWHYHWEDMGIFNFIYICNILGFINWQLFSMILEGPLEKGWKEALDKRGVNFSEIYFVKLEIIQFIDLNCFKLTWTHFSNFFDFMFSQSIPRCTIFQIAIDLKYHDMIWIQVPLKWWPPRSTSQKQCVNNSQDWATMWFKV